MFIDSEKKLKNLLDSLKVSARELQTSLYGREGSDRKIFIESNEWGEFQISLSHWNLPASRTVTDYSVLIGVESANLDNDINAPLMAYELESLLDKKNIGRVEKALFLQPSRYPVVAPKIIGLPKPKAPPLFNTEPPTLDYVDLPNFPDHNNPLWPANKLFVRGLLLTWLASIAAVFFSKNP